MVKKISLPLQLVAVLIFVAFFGSYLSEDINKLFYTFSLIFKELLGLVLPFIVFFFISSGILSFKRNAAVVVILLLSLIIFSNFSVAMFSYLVGMFSLPFIQAKPVNGGIVSSSINSLHELNPFFTITMPKLVPTEKAMVLALFIGILFSVISAPRVERFLNTGKVFVEWVLNKLFIPFLPMYVFGFLLKINYDGVIGSLFNSYGKSFVLIVLVHYLYLFVMYCIARSFNLSLAFQSIKNSAPSYLTAFGTMSSTATIPVTINCAKKNDVNTSLAATATPIMANVHLVGDGITVPIFALVSTSIFLGSVPEISVYLKFVFYFCLTMLATSGVPGGGIIVMIPILKSILGFTPEMISIITTLYLLQDGFGTAANVMGDGALMIIANNFLKRFKIV